MIPFILAVPAFAVKAVTAVKVATVAKVATTAVVGGMAAKAVYNAGKSTGHYEGHRDGCEETSKVYERKMSDQKSRFEDSLEEAKSISDAQDKLVRELKSRMYGAS